jgi:hypothetical protein
VASAGITNHGRRTAGGGCVGGVIVDIALAYAGVLKAPPPATFAQRWTAWGASFGGANSTNDNATVGSSNVTTGRVQTRHHVGGEVIIHPTSKAEHVEKPVLPRESSGFV